MSAVKAKEVFSSILLVTTSETSCSLLQLLHLSRQQPTACPVPSLFSDTAGYIYTDKRGCVCAPLPLSAGQRSGVSSSQTQLFNVGVFPTPFTLLSGWKIVQVNILWDQAKVECGIAKTSAMVLQAVDWACDTPRLVKYSSSEFFVKKIRCCFWTQPIQEKFSTGCLPCFSSTGTHVPAPHRKFKVHKTGAVLPLLYCRIFSLQPHTLFF